MHQRQGVFKIELEYKETIILDDCSILQEEVDIIHAKAFLVQIGVSGRSISIVKWH